MVFMVVYINGCSFRVSQGNILWLNALFGVNWHGSHEVRWVRWKGMFFQKSQMSQMKRYVFSEKSDESDEKVCFSKKKSDENLFSKNLVDLYFLLKMKFLENKIFINCKKINVPILFLFIILMIFFYFLLFYSSFFLVLSEWINKS